MWNPSKSVTASVVCTKIMIGIAICATIFAAHLVKSYVILTMKDMSIIYPLTVTSYVCALPGLLALLSLDRLLANIKKREIFIEKNVKYLRVISWCCFVVSITLLISGFYYILFVAIGVVAAFFGLIVRVVKNVIEQAVIIKNENDFTI